VLLCFFALLNPLSTIISNYIHLKELDFQNHIWISLSLFIPFSKTLSHISDDREIEIATTYRKAVGLAMTEGWGATRSLCRLAMTARARSQKRDCHGLSYGSHRIYKYIFFKRYWPPFTLMGLSSSLQIVKFFFTHTIPPFLPLD
jgi:hypothetical protein